MIPSYCSHSSGPGAWLEPQPPQQMDLTRGFVTLLPSTAPASSQTQSITLCGADFTYTLLVNENDELVILRSGPNSTQQVAKFS